MTSTDAASDGTGPPRDDLEAWAARHYVTEDRLLRDLRQAMEDKGLPLIQVPARTGLLLQVLTRAVGARRVVEVGTLGGYSAIWIARALPSDGTLVTIEKEPTHAALARLYLEAAGLSDTVAVHEGSAGDLLPTLEAGTWDVVFLDADKEGYPDYLREAARLLRPGGLLLADNAFFHGRVLDSDPSDLPAEGLRTFHKALSASGDFVATVIPTGDGVAVAVRI